MVSFIYYDLGFLVVFLLVTIFLFHKYKSNIQRQGWIFLYHSKVGLKSMDWVVKKFEKILRPLQYVVITSGYILMAFILWMLSFSAWKYITNPIPAQLQNVPPIAPLIPYFPRLFGLESLFPPLFFTYFLIALGIVAVSHEFAHGVFARLHKVKIKTTGLAFFGPFFGAFVEPDEKAMQKLPKRAELAILAAGTFANVVMTILFLFVLWGFFAVSFEPAGVNFNVYPQQIINVGDIIKVEGNVITSVSEIPNFIIEERFNEIEISGVGETIFLVPGDSLINAVESEAERMIVFGDAPAVRARLTGPILEIDGQIIPGPEALGIKIKTYSPGETIEIVTLGDDGSRNTIEITLAELNGNAYLGVGFRQGRRTIIGKLFTVIQEIKDPFIYYEPTWDGKVVEFIYDLIWWIIVINILVALFNMLPVALLDGGRFFYLTIWGLTGSEKAGRKSYKFMTYFIIFLLIAMTVKWFISFIS